jgi:hypothetical protein
MMPNAMDLAIKSMMEDAVTQAVTALSAKHGFELDVALRDLNLGELKLVRKRGPSPKAEKSKGKKASADKPKKKRGTNGYLQFSDAHRPEVRSEMEGKLEEGAKLAPQDVVKELGARWKAASAEEQTIWNDKAKEINDAASSVATSAASSETSSPALSEDDTPVEKKKKKPSGYILYGGAKRAEVKEKLMSELAEGEKMPNLMAAVAAAWKAESEEVKAEWNAKAKLKAEAEDETEAK